MNLDFHYYATYPAARYAKFTQEPALTIARSTQMVYAMECVLNDREFEPENIPEDYNNKILLLLTTRKLDQSREWETLICQEIGTEKPLPAYHVGD